MRKKLFFTLDDEAWKAGRARGEAVAASRRQDRGVANVLRGGPLPY